MFSAITVVVLAVRSPTLRDKPRKHAVESRHRGLPNRVAEGVACDSEDLFKKCRSGFEHRMILRGSMLNILERLDRIVQESKNAF